MGVANRLPLLQIIAVYTTDFLSMGSVARELVTRVSETFFADLPQKFFLMIVRKLGWIGVSSN
jgi:hypothetical protein